MNMKDLRLGIIGGGVVGKATARAYLEHVKEVRIYDVVLEKSTHDLCGVLDCNLIMICLPTPQMKDSLECDTSAIERFIRDMSERSTRTREASSRFKGLCLVLRSTVPIGFTRRMRDAYGLPNLVHSPEFLTARCAETDAMLPTRNVIGCPNVPGTPDAEELKCFSMLRRLYSSRFPGVPIHVMSSDESEAVKLYQNSFFAVKVAFFNEINLLSERLGLDWDAVLNAMLADGRISHNHTKVPGPDGKFGFGGSCLPKDLGNLISLLDPSRKEGGHHVDDVVGDAQICEAAFRRNKYIDREREVR